jgi:hypothetical protein
MTDLNFNFKISDYNIGVIYLIIGPNLEHKYIGQTKIFRNDSTKTRKFKYFNYIGRFKEHIVAAKYKPTYHVDKIIQEYKPENFSVKLIKYCYPEELDYYEIKYIKKFNTLHPNGLNIVLGNPHKNNNWERTSTILKKYYSNIEIKQKHSLVHRSKFKDIDINNIKKILIKPIKKNNINKIVYMYIEFLNLNIIRRRYGGIHEIFNDAYERCKKDSLKLTNISNIVDYINNEPLNNLGNIILAELKIHKLNKYELISLYITNTEVKNWDQKKRFVFGGKTISLEQALNKAIEFIKKHNIDINKINISTNLIATLPNCWNLLRA